MMVAASDVADLEAQGWARITHAQPHDPTPAENRAKWESVEKASWRKPPADALLAWMLPPMTGPSVTLNIEGRQYAGKQGQPQAIPLEDARILARNGWLMVGHAALSSGRPVTPQRGELCVDLEPKRLLMFDGEAWRDVFTGGVV
jgi:hypothetical protein